MGTWGHTPFDSDAALDYCDYLQKISAGRNISTFVRDSLLGTDRPLQWVSVGLVQRAITDPSQLRSDDYGAHYDGMLTREAAEPLVPLAVQACRDLLNDSKWHSEWLNVSLLLTELNVALFSLSIDQNEQESITQGDEPG